MISRRQFCKYLAAASASAAVFDLGYFPSLAAADEYFKVTELGKGQWMFSGGGGNVLLLQNTGNPLLVDAGVGALVTELLGKITDRIGTTSCTVINTHHHGDHIGGNFGIRHGFAAEVAIYGHRNLTPRVGETLEEAIRPGLIRVAESNAVPSEDKEKRIAEITALVAADFEPTKTFAEELILQTGDLECQLHHFGSGHTDNDAVVFLPRENILHMGDLIFHELHPYVIPEHGANVAGWQKSLNRALELCDKNTVVIPGHGEFSDRTAIIKMNEYFDQVTGIVGASIKEGRTREEVAELKPEIFAGRGFAHVQQMTLTKVYDELSAGR